MTYRSLAKVLLICSCLFVCTPVSALTEAQKGVISQSCETIKNSLRNTQKLDSRTRTRLGAKYETIYSHFIDPFNHRLLENNALNQPFIDQRANFVSARSAFSSYFISYSKALEELLNIDCTSDPETFYLKLLEVRAKREMVHGQTVKLQEIIINHHSMATDLRSLYE